MRRSFHLPFLALIGAATGCAGGTPADAPDGRAVERADSLMMAFVDGEGPGCALAVAHGGGIRYERGYGMAVLEHAIRIDERTTFDIGSVGKQFTAAAVLRLAADKRLSLEDSLARWIPGLAPALRAVRVRDLLHHTSGVRDYGALGMMAGTHPRSMPAFLALMRRQRGLNFGVGSRHDYSHSDYTLLAAVVEAAVGMSYGRWMEDSLFAPAGMHRTRVLDAAGEPVVGQALAYERDGTGLRTRFPGSMLVGGDNTYTSAADLLRWDLALDGGRVVPGAIAVTLRAPLHWTFRTWPRTRTVAGRPGTAGTGCSTATGEVGFRRATCTSRMLGSALPCCVTGRTCIRSRSRAPSRTASSRPARSSRIRPRTSSRSRRGKSLAWLAATAPGRCRGIHFGSSPMRGTCTSCGVPIRRSSCVDAMGDGRATARSTRFPAIRSAALSRSSWSGTRGTRWEVGSVIRFHRPPVGRSSRVMWVRGSATSC
ncbi:MAG: beta-lactamase family protein [Gemmatimonadetes bacterium]|nr:beta-lactamase family protein [Gemmatimonadota bacterium]